METFLIYSLAYNRQLNYHRSKDQVKRRFEKLNNSCEELQELVERFIMKVIQRLEKLGGAKIPREDIRIYIVNRERGGSFHEPLTLQYDEDQKFMFAELVHLIGHHIVNEEGALGEAKINLLAEVVLDELPLDFARQIHRLHDNQQRRYPAYFRLDPEKYDPRDKPIPELFPPIEKKEQA